MEHESAGTPGGTALGQDIVHGTYDLLGYRAAVGAPPGDAHAAVRSILRGFGPLDASSEPSLPRYCLTATATGGWEVRVEDKVVHTGDNFSISLQSLEWHIVTDALGHRDDLFHLHGAALCLPTRPAGLLLVGNSRSGKTTLTLGLMLRGFVPFADDVALIEPATLKLRALRRGFHVDAETWRLLEPLAGPIGADEDGLSGHFFPPQWAEQAVPVRWLLFLADRPQQTPQLTPMSPAEAATAILGQTLSLSRTARLALTTTARLTERARCYRFVSGDLPASIATIQRLVAAPVSVPGK